MMYLVEGRNAHETRGQYVLSKEAAHAIFKEMQNDFLKVNIYEKVDGEYKRIEKWERVQTEREYIQTCNTEQLAEALLEWWIDGADTYTQFGLFQHEIDEAKEKIVAWLKQPHTTE